MQFAGQIWGHRPHATHLARPCASVSMRCVPRQRGASVQSLLLFSSGYCMVTLGRHRRSEEHTSELQSPCNLVCRLLLEKKNLLLLVKTIGRCVILNRFLELCACTVTSSE